MTGPRPGAMFRFMALVNGPDGDSGDRLAKGFDDAADQQAAFDELRPRLVERLLRDSLPAWALLHLEADRRVRAANRAAARLQERHAEVLRLEAGRERGRARARRRSRPGGADRRAAGPSPGATSLHPARGADIRAPSLMGEVDVEVVTTCRGGVAGCRGMFPEEDGGAPRG